MNPISVILADFDLSTLAGVGIIFLTVAFVLLCWLVALVAWCRKNRKAAGEWLKGGVIVLILGILAGYGLILVMHAFSN
jgi:hypothetical protein